MEKGDKVIILTLNEPLESERYKLKQGILKDIIKRKNGKVKVTLYVVDTDDGTALAKEVKKI